MKKHPIPIKIQATDEHTHVMFSTASDPFDWATEDMCWTEYKSHEEAKAAIALIAEQSPSKLQH